MLIYLFLLTYLGFTLTYTNFYIKFFHITLYPTDKSFVNGTDGDTSFYTNVYFDECVSYKSKIVDGRNVYNPNEETNNDFTDLNL